MFNKANQPGPMSVEMPFGDAAPDLAWLLKALPGRPSFIYERVSTRTRGPERTYIGIGEMRCTSQSVDTDAFEVLRKRLADNRSSPNVSTALLAFISYEALRNQTSSTPAQPCVPLYTILQPALLLELDHVRGIARLSGDYQAAVEAVGAALLHPSSTPRERLEIGSERDASQQWVPKPDKRNFALAVAEVKKRIKERGDVVGVCLSVELEFEASLDSLESYLVLREINPSTCMFFLEQDQFSLWGATSLSVLQVRNGRLSAETDGATRRVEAGVTETWIPTGKEMEEYDLVVAALRDDLKGVIVPASFRFVAEREQRTYYNLRHLFAELAGDLAEGIDAVTALKRLTPHGAATGYNKSAAMDLIDQFEGHRRGPYAAAIGVFDVAGDADAACVIRSTWQAGATIRTRAGAKIVAGSDPAAEYEESVLKTLALRRAIAYVLSRGTQIAAR